MPNSLPPVRASTSPLRSADISRRAKVISSSSPARLPIDSLMRREAQHVDHQHRMFEVAAALAAAHLDRLGERQAVGQAGQAVAQHLRAKRPLGPHLDRPVDHADQAARPPLLAARQRRQLDPVMPRADPLALAEVELARRLRSRPGIRSSAGRSADARSLRKSPLIIAGSPVSAITSSNRALRSISRKMPLEVSPTIAAAIGSAASKAWSSADARMPWGSFWAAERAPVGAAERFAAACMDSAVNRDRLMAAFRTCLAAG